MPTVLIGLPSATGRWPGAVWTNVIKQTRQPATIFLQERQSIVAARNTICKHTLQNGFDYVYMQDDDNVIDPYAVDRMMTHGKTLIAALIMQRGQDRDSCVFKKVRDKRNPEIPTFEKIPAEQLRGRGLVEADAVGFGAVLIHRSLLEQAYAIHHNPFQLLVKTKRARNEYSVYPMGEDVSFCVHARELGHRSWVDTSIGSIHYGLPREHRFQA